MSEEVNEENNEENGSGNIKIVLIGEMATGKTSLINAYLGLSFSKNVDSTLTPSVSQKEIQINETEKISIGLSSPDGADSPTLDGVQIGEITQAQADSIIDKQMLSADLLLTSTGRYYRIKG